MQIGQWYGRVEFPLSDGFRKPDAHGAPIDFPDNGTRELCRTPVILQVHAHRITNLHSKVQIGHQHAGQAQVDQSGR